MSFTPTATHELTLEREIRDSAYLPRWAIVRTIRQQSVAEHSYFVGIYASRLADWYGWEGDRGALLYSALTHDLDELITGDIPRPAKVSMLRDPGTKQAHKVWLKNEAGKHFPWLTETDSADVRMLVEFADMLEALAYCCEEMRMGNSAMESYKNNMFEIARSCGVRADAHFNKKGLDAISERIVYRVVNQELNEFSRIVGK